MIVWHLFPGIFFLITIFHLVFPLRIGKEWKTTIVIAALVISQLRFINRAIFQAIGWPGTPSWMVVFQGLLLSIVVLLVIFVILRNIAGLALWLCKKSPSAMFSSGQLTLGMSGLAVLLSVFGVWQGVRVPDVRRREISIPNLPADLNGFTIVQISDLHATNLFHQRWVREVVERVNAQKPDLVIITGDIADGTPERRSKDIAPLGDMKARFGVFGVPGNHEYLLDYAARMSAFEKLNVRMLQNEHTVITQNGSSMVLAGITDRAAIRRGTPLPNTALALEGCPAGATRILISHQPDNAPENAALGIDLQVSGHTHGGQIYGLHHVVKYANNGFVSGLYRVGNMQLYVSNGAGLWPGFPIRLGRPSEIAKIVLVTGNN